jgi:hypothetical protein
MVSIDVSPVYTSENGDMMFGCMYYNPNTYAVRNTDMKTLISTLSEFKNASATFVSDDTLTIGFENEVFKGTWKVKLYKSGDWSILFITMGEWEVIDESGWSQLPFPMCLAYKSYNQSAFSLQHILIAGLVAKLPENTLYRADRYSFDKNDKHCVFEVCK